MDFQHNMAEPVANPPTFVDTASKYERCRAGEIKRGRNPRGRSRKQTDPDWPQFLADISARGMLQPIGVRKLPSGERELVWGNSRLDAWIELYGVDAIVEYKLVEAGDEAALAMAFAENVQRSDMTPVDEAKAAAWLLAQFDGDKARVAERLSISAATLNSRLGLMNAIESVQEAFLDNKIKLGHLELLAALPIPMQEQALTKILSLAVLPTVDAVRTSIAAVARPLKGACFDTQECSGCRHNSDTQVGLFAESIAGGSCTNPQCFAGKTEAKLEELRSGLVEETPRVEIVRPGQNYAVIQIKADGPKALGEQQAQACRACADFGIAISGVPGKEGQVFRDFCFKPSCHATLVAKHGLAQAEKAAAQAQAKAQAKQASQAHASTDVEQADKPAAPKKATSGATSTGTVTAAVTEFRLKVWREALAACLQAEPGRAAQFLVMLGLTNQAHHVDRGILVDHLVFETGDKLNRQIAGHTDSERGLEVVRSLSNQQLAASLGAMAASAAGKVPEDVVRVGLRQFEIDLLKHFVVDERFLKLLMKSQIEAIAREIGLGDKLDLKAVANEKKPDMIAKILAVEGFDYRVLPTLMKP